MKKVIFKGEGSSIFTTGKAYDVLVTLETRSVVVVDDTGKNSLMFKVEYEPLEEDKIVQRVLSRFNERSQAGMKKYSTTLERSDLSVLEWLTHLQEELMDATLYIERLKDEYDTERKTID